MLGKALEATDRFSSGVASVDDGSVEDELKRADEEDVSKSPPLEDELLVPPLPLDGISNLTCSVAPAAYRLLRLGSTLVPANMFSSSLDGRP